MLYSARSSKYIGWFEFSDERIKNLEKEILNQSKYYILNTNEEDYKNYLLNKYSLEQLSIIESSKRNYPPVQKEHEKDPNIRSYRSYTYYECKTSFEFCGNRDLWYVRGTTFTLAGTDFSISGNTVTYTFTIQTQSPEEYKRENEGAYKKLISNLEYINQDALRFNNELPAKISRLFSNIKASIIQENDFFAAIGVTFDSDASKTYAVPVVTKKPHLNKPNITKRSYSQNPTIDTQTYQNIIECLSKTGASMERKPSLYMGKDEEGIRDFFLTQLELGFTGGTVTGETFNRVGKTDILLKNIDGTNLFVGECKFWKGEKVFLDTISQLLSYLTWQDSKTSILVFVKNESIMKVIETAKQSLRQHLNYKSRSSIQERSFSCIFTLPQDNNRDVLCEIIFFHFDK